MARNPAWTVEEIILATELWLNNERRVVGPDHPDVIALSKLLNELSIHPKEKRTDSFRNPTSVSMKLRNIRSLDPNWNGAASNAGANDDYFWRVLDGDEAALNREAASIRAQYSLASG